VFALVATVLLAPAGARAGDGPDDEVRVVGRCSGGGASELRVRARDDGELRVDLALRSRRPAQRWLVVVVHERRLEYRGRVSAGRSSHRAKLRRSVVDLFGPDTVSIRASSGPGETCRASATVGDE
jgi:hypothetical protein